MRIRAKNKLAVLRWILSASAFTVFVLSMRAAFKIESYGAAAYVIFALVCFIASILLLIPETVKPTCRYFSGLIIAFIFPDHKFSKPTLTYTLARRYMELERYEDAINEYAKIIHYYPGETEAYLEGKYHQGYKRQMDIYVHILRNMDFKVSDTTYFMVCNGEKTNDFFENRIDFKTVLVPYKSDPSWIPNKIKEMKNILESDKIPEYNI